MVIFRNRRDISNVLCVHDKQNFVVFLIISFVRGTERLFIQKTRCFEEVCFYEMSSFLPR